MKTIPLTQGKIAFVDDEDFERLAKWKWYAWSRRRAGRLVWYAARAGRKGEARTVWMHRELMDAVTGELIDHENGDGLDNRRRANLRRCTRAGNMHNMAKRPGCSSKYKGVYWDSRECCWRSKIKLHDKGYGLGTFDEEEDAAIVYDVAAQLLFGEFARLNFPRAG